MICVLVLYPVSYTGHLRPVLIYCKREHIELLKIFTLTTESVFVHQLLTEHTHCLLSNQLMFNIPHHHTRLIIELVKTTNKFVKEKLTNQYFTAIKLVLNTSIAGCIRIPVPKKLNKRGNMGL